MSALSVFTAPIELAPAPAPRERHLRVMTEVDAHRAAAEYEARRRASTPAPMVLTARGRWALRVLGAVAALLAAIAIGAAMGMIFRPAVSPGESVVVASGESLWTIASEHGSGDVSEVVAQIVTLNGLTGSEIQPGQVLVLPASH